MISKKGNAEKIYINEIIRITYKCNWQCKFCNVLKTNNFGKNDISNKEIIHQILNLTRKYSLEQRKNLILSFSGGEPTLNNNLLKYIKLAKEVGIGTIQLQTNGTILFKNKTYVDDLITSGLDEIFLAQHGYNIDVNKKIGTSFFIEDFLSWIIYLKENKLDKSIQIQFNIVINKINLFHLNDYIIFLNKSGFINLLPLENNNGFLNTKRISFGLVQPNGYANINKEEVLLVYNNEQITEIEKIINLCIQNNIYSDFHFTAPPLCILNYPEYNLEYQRLKNLEEDTEKLKINEGNLDSYKNLWKEKRKFDECKNCKYNNYCLGFYNNWIDFVGEKYIKEKINNFIN